MILFSSSGPFLPLFVLPPCQAGSDLSECRTHITSRETRRPERECIADAVRLNKGKGAAEEGKEGRRNRWKIGTYK